MTRPAERVWEWWCGVAGGPARARALLLLSLILGLDSADLGTVGAVAGELEKALSLDNTQLGLIAAVPSLCAALVTLPMGVLADRVNRVRLLWISVIVWSAIEGICAVAWSFDSLLLIRVGLGAATAATWPAVASLVGDLFPPSERGRIWSLILSGELVGAAFGYLIAGEVASFGTGYWRLAFIVLAIPSLATAFAVRRWLPEPARGGQGQLAEGAERLEEATEAETVATEADDAEAFISGRAQKEVRRQQVEPDPELTLRSDPERLDLLSAARYVLRIRTNVVLIVASALGYFYFTGIETFGVVYFEDRYHLAHGVAILAIGPLALGGLAGVLVGGRVADTALKQGRMDARIVVGAVGFSLAALLFLPGLIGSSLVIALPFMTAAAFFFGARNPPLDAARLDIMHHRLWGRAESVRTLLRRTLTASAPIVFGAIADALAPPHPHSQLNGTHGFGANANAHGIELASLVLLITLVAGGLLTFLARESYPRDVATAVASEEQTAAAMDEAA